MTWNRKFLAVLALMVLAFTACGGSDDTPTATGASSEDAAASDGAPANLVEDYDFDTLNGQPALVWFWAPW